jgi:hypothetical protein
MLGGRQRDKSRWQKIRQELEYIVSTLLSESRWWSKNCFNVSADGGLSKVAHEFGGWSPCGGGDRASGSIGTGWAISIVMVFAINSE